MRPLFNFARTKKHPVLLGWVIPTTRYISLIRILFRSTSQNHNLSLKISWQSPCSALPECSVLKLTTVYGPSGRFRLSPLLYLLQLLLSSIAHDIWKISTYILIVDALHCIFCICSNFCSLLPHLIFGQFLHILMVDALHLCFFYFQIHYFVVTLSFGDFLANIVLPIYQWGPQEITYLKKAGDKYRFDSSPFSTILPMTMCARTYGPPRPVEHQRRRGVGQQISRESGNFKAIYTPLPAVRPTRDVHTWDFKTGLLTCWWLRVICTFGRHWLWTISLTGWARSKERL